MNSAPPNVRVVGRYALYGAIAAGGMATVHLGRLLGPVGFSRTVAIKRLHAQFASDPEFVSMFLDEARLAARIRHPNVVPTLDVVATGGELFLVMEYVPGESAARLARALRERQHVIPVRILSAVIAGVLHGLHSAHEARDERGHPLGIVHRDVSPQNVLVGTDGVPRVLDFGVAKAAGRMQTTKEGQIKGKLSYMPPEQLRGAAVSRQTDIYAVGVMLWELLTGQRLFSGDNEGVIVAKVLEGKVERPSMVLLRTRRETFTDVVMKQLESLDATILKALSMDPASRFVTAREMAIELERRAPPATASEVGDWVENVARDVLTSRAAMIAEIESSASHASVETNGDHVMSVLNAKHSLTSAQMREALVRGGSSPVLTPTPPPFASGAYPGLGDPPFTNPSSISVATGTSAGIDRSGKRTAVAAIIGVLLGASVLAGALLYRQSIRQRPIAEANQGGDPMPPVTATPPLGSTAAGIIVDAGPPAVTQDSHGDETVADAGPRKTAPPPIPTKFSGIPKGGPKGSAAATEKKDPPPPPPPAPPPGPDCTTPFTYDSNGIKKYKPECLEKPK